MTLLAERFPTAHPQSASLEGSDRAGCLVAPLDSQIYREMRWCGVCEAEEEFRTVFEFCCGRVGVCLGCGDERVVPFSRATEAV